MTPKGKLIALVHEIRDETSVGHPLRKTAHDLDDSDAIILTREELDDVMFNQGHDRTARKALEAELWDRKN